MVDGAVRHEDVAVGRLAQPVDHAAGEAVAEGQQRPAALVRQGAANGSITRLPSPGGNE